MKYKLDDSVLHRVVQIVQEAFLTGVDCADIMRQIELEEDKSGPPNRELPRLVLTDSYKEMVRRHHEEMLKFAEEEQKRQKQAKHTVDSPLMPIDLKDFKS